MKCFLRINQLQFLYNLKNILYLEKKRKGHGTKNIPIIKIKEKFSGILLNGIIIGSNLYEKQCFVAETLLTWYRLARQLLLSSFVSTTLNSPLMPSLAVGEPTRKLV